MSKILVLNGSPRKGGNTEMLVNAFKNGAEQKGHEVEVVYVQGKNIKGCMACDACKKTGVCVQKDDMADVLKSAREADALVVASPMYFYGLTGQLKCCYDRLYAMGESNIKKTGMLLVCADESPSAFDGVVTAHKANAEFDKWEYVGEVRACGVHGKGDILQTAFLEQAEELAEKF